MSGSLASDISDGVVRSDLVKENRTIADDLNSLRTQVKGILGEGAWTDEQAVSLSQVYAAMHVDGANAEVQGNLSVIGESTLASAIVSDLTETRVVFAGANGALVDSAALTFAAGIVQVDGAVDATGWVRGSVGLTSGLFGENTAEFQSNGPAYIGSAGTSHDGKLYINQDVAGRLYIVDSDGSVKDEENLSFAEGKLSVTGALEVTGEVTLASAIVSDLTQSRVVFAGADGALVDDAALTFASDPMSELSILSVGTAARNGTIELRNSAGSTTATLNASNGSGRFGSYDGVSGQITLHDSGGSPSIELWGADARVSAGEFRTNGSHAVITDTNDPSVPTAAFGGYGANGSVWVKNVDGNATVRLNGELGSIAHGLTSTATGVASFAGGHNASASGMYSFASGQNVNASGEASHAEGYYTTASGYYSHAEGGTSIAEGARSHAEGNGTAAVGDYSHAGGLGTEAFAAAQTAIGKFNVQANADSLFVVGNGTTWEARSDAFRVDPTVVKSFVPVEVGTTGAAGTVSVKNASDAQTIKLDGGAAQVDIGGGTSGYSGYFNVKKADDVTTLYFSGSDAWLSIGNTGKEGTIQVNDNSGAGSIYLEGQSGYATIGGPVAGTVSVKDASYVETIKLDGATGDVTFEGNADVNGTLDVAGQVDLAAAGVATSIRGTLAVAEDATFAGNIQVDGDFRVKGSMTYIDTQHVRVEDAFIYLATGSLGTTDSGIVLHGGAGVGMDLAIAQKGGSGEFIFGKGDRQPDGEGSLVGMELVPAKFAGIKLGSAEDALSGSLSISGDNIKVAAAAAALVLDDAYRAGSSYSGDFKLASSAAEWTAFQNQYPGKSLLGALGAGGGVGVNFRKKVLMGDNANFSGNTLDIAAAGIGTLRSTAQADADYGLDVYLNGVLLALGAQADYTVASTSEISFNYAINSDDVLTVIAKNVA